MILTGLSNAAEFTETGFLKYVLENNLDLEIARQDLKLSKNQQNEARSTALPKVIFEGSYTRNLNIPNMYFDPEFGAMLGDTSGNPVKVPMGKKNDYGVNAVISQPLFDANAFYARRAAREYTDLSRNLFIAVEQTVVAYARKAFYQTLLAQKVWEVSQQTAQNAHQNFIQMQDKYAQGLVSEFELLQAELRWKNQIPQVSKDQRNYELALNYLMKMGNIQDEEFSITGGFEQYPPIPEKPGLDTVLKNRPDFQAQIKEEQLRGTNLKSKTAAFLPSLSMNAVWSFSGSSDEFVIDNDNNLKMVGLNLSWPIWLGGYNQAQVSKARIELRKSGMRALQTRQDIQIDIDNIYLRLAESRNRIEAAEQTLDTAQKAFQIAESSAETGLATQLELREARTSFDQAQLNFYGAVYDYLDAWFDWELATGNGMP